MPFPVPKVRGLLTGAHPSCALPRLQVLPARGSRSPFGIDRPAQSLFAAIARNAGGLCGGLFASLFKFELFQRRDFLPDARALTHLRSRPAAAEASALVGKAVMTIRACLKVARRFGPIVGAGYPIRAHALLRNVAARWNVQSPGGCTF